MDYVLDVIGSQGTPFRVVYGNRVYPTGNQCPYPTVAFYDRRYPNHSSYGGQFVSEYHSETLLSWDHTRGLALSGDDVEWTVDVRTMRLVIEWLASILNPDS